MKFKPTPNGGRLIAGDTPYGAYRVELPRDYDGPVYDAEGHEVGRVMLAMREPTPRVSNIGSRYKSALRRRLGGIPCRACDAERDRLNTLTPEQAQAQRDQIIAATVERAKNLPRWRDRIRAKLGDRFAPDYLRRVIGECLDEAINHTE